MFLDADDLLPPHYLARFVEAAAAAPRAEVFHCGWRGIDFDEGAFSTGRTCRSTSTGTRSTPLRLQVRRPSRRSPYVAATATRVGPFDETESLQADWDYWLRLAASGATFQGVPGNVVIIRRRNDSMSASAGTQLAVEGLAVLERHLSRHQRCPACIYSDAGLRSWRQAVLRSSARDFARRLHLEGRTGRLIGAAVAVACRPRLASTAWLALREKRRTG